MKDSDYAEHLLGDTEDGSVERYSSGGANGVIAGGGYMMIGDPPGSMLDSVIVLLRNPSGALVDYVRVRGAADGLDNEVYARFPSGGDTNVDIIDFTSLEASPLGQNNHGIRPPEAANRFDVLLTEHGGGGQSAERLGRLGRRDGPALRRAAVPRARRQGLDQR